MSVSFREPAGRFGPGLIEGHHSHAALNRPGFRGGRFV